MAPVTLTRLIVKDLDQKNVTGQNNWAVIKKPGAFAIVEASTAPKNSPDEWSLIKWSGDKADEVKGRPNQRKFALNASRQFNCTAEIAPFKLSISLWVLWASVKILASGKTPAGAVQFDKIMRDGTQDLGAVTYSTMKSTKISKAPPDFVNSTEASGKIVVEATLQPTGVKDVVKDGWMIRRERWTHDWANGNPTKLATTGWVDDTSKPEWLNIKPGIGDKIYDTDGPNLLSDVFSNETYNNFRQWVEWKGQQSSDKALWYFQGRWAMSRDPKKQVELVDVAADRNITLPAKPYYKVRTAKEIDDWMNDGP